MATPALALSHMSRSARDADADQASRDDAGEAWARGTLGHGIGWVIATVHGATEANGTWARCRLAWGPNAANMHAVCQSMGPPACCAELRAVATTSFAWPANGVCAQADEWWSLFTGDRSVAALLRRRSTLGLSRGGMVGRQARGGVRGTFAPPDFWRVAVGSHHKHQAAKDEQSVAAPALNPPLASLTLRDATTEDELCLSVLAMQVFLDTYATKGIRPEIAREVLSSYSRQAFAHALADRATRIVVAEHDGHMIGFSQVTLGQSHELAPPGAQSELLRLYVQEPFTRLKVGSSLLAAAEQVAGAAGASVLWLTPWIHNHRALAFYARRGYEDHGLTYFTFEGESHQNRVLAKPLATSSAA